MQTSLDFKTVLISLDEEDFIDRIKVKDAEYTVFHALRMGGMGAWNGGRGFALFEGFVVLAGKGTAKDTKILRRLNRIFRRGTGGRVLSPGEDGVLEWRLQWML